MSSNIQYDKKIFRLMSVLGLLDSRKTVLTRELAEQFNVSIRTVQRDLELLDMTGFPVVMLEKGQYAFAEGYSLAKMKLTDREASLLAFFQEISSSLGGEFKKVYSGLLHKVLNAHPEAPYYVKMPHVDFSSGDMTFWKDLEEAINTTKKITISYDKKGKDKEYILSPLKLINYEGFWYLLALNDEGKGIRTFRLEKIKKVELLAKSFDVPKNLHAMLDQSTNIWFSGKRDKTVVLHIEAQVAGFFKKKAYVPLQKIKTTHKDGSLTVECKVGNDMEILPIILHWIPNIRVVSPVSLKDKINKDLKAYIKS